VPETTWIVQDALTAMHGIEQASRLLIADMDREIVDRDSYGEAGQSPIGIAIVTTVLSSLFCEHAITTFHASLSQGHFVKGHRLAAQIGESKNGLYDHLEERYMTVEHAVRGDLSRVVIEQMRRHPTRRVSQ